MVGGGQCNGTALNIQPNQIIAKFKANSSGMVNRKFFVPSTSAHQAKLQALDIATCDVSKVFKATLAD